MNHYNIIGIDLAKRKFHIAAINHNREVVLKKAITREDFFNKFLLNLAKKQTFAFEACGGCHYVAQVLQEQGHQVIMLKAKDVKAFAKIKQKNDINDAIAICRAALDPELMRVHIKSKQEQGISYIHKTRQNIIQQRIQISNSLITSLLELGYIVKCGKSKFAKSCSSYIEEAFKERYFDESVYAEMLLECQEIQRLLIRELNVDRSIIQKNKASELATKLETIPGIGPINASILSNKPMKNYNSAKDFSASLGLVPKQNTTGGNIKLGSITKQGDRYARTMLIQGARSIVMRSYRKGLVKKTDDIYQFIERLEARGKGFNLICVAVANKLARIAYSCYINNREYLVA
jgi:transposase